MTLHPSLRARRGSSSAPHPARLLLPGCHVRTRTSARGSESRPRSSPTTSLRAVTGPRSSFAHPQCCHFGLVQPWTTRSKVGPMSPSVVQGRPFCGGLEWSKANFGRAGPGPRWDLAWRSANLEKFRLRRSFARGPAPSTPVLEEPLDFEAGREKKEGFLNLISSGPMWSNVGPMWPLPRHPKWSNVPQNVKSQH